MIPGMHVVITAILSKPSSTAFSRPSRRNLPPPKMDAESHMRVVLMLFTGGLS